jgi:hypothetical protein
MNSLTRRKERKPRASTGRVKIAKPITLSESYYNAVKELADRHGRKLNRQLENIIDAGLPALDASGMPAQQS